MNVLIVEDDASARKMLRITLEHYGCTVIEARDGQEGLELAAQHTPDIIISDALMPRMDGFQLLRALKLTPELQTIPFIFYSSTYTGEKEHELALSLGAEAFINKPVEPADLWEKTCSIMKAWEDRRKQPANPTINGGNEQFLREYSQVVATKLEEKVQELEDALELRKQAEEELRRLNAELEQRIAQEVAKNQEKDRILAHQARLSAMGEMLSNLAHQWRQPLNNVSLIVQNLLVEYEDRILTPAACREYVEECINILMYMSHTIDDFYAFYQPDSARQSFELFQVITESVVLVRTDLESHGIVIKLSKECDLPVSGYKKEFSQVLLNLIQNAKEAILLRQTPEPFVEITCSCKGTSALVTVLDNGGGIPSEIQDQIFDPYFTSKFKSQGAGMGLYISKIIIEKHIGGTISVSNKGSGTEVAIEIPLEQTADTTSMQNQQ
jgi:signal transduction histidine kinase